MRNNARSETADDRPAGGASNRGLRRGRHGLGLERLETRLALCANHVLDELIDPALVIDGYGVQTLSGMGVPATDPAESFAVSLATSTGTLSTVGGDFVATANAANGLPILHSLPGAPTAIYLDFDGEGSNAGYDVDGVPATFNATEAATITEAWRQISVYFAMFDIDVSTEKPTVPFAWHVSSPSISGGYSYVGVFPNTSAQSFNNDSHARTRVSGIAHELGHNFGLNHQSDYDLLGVKTAEYSSGFDALHGPIMGVDYAQSIHKWFIGHPSNSASSLQDDIAVIAGKIKARQSAGGDGFRIDDYGGTIATAQPLTASAGSRTASGIIERMADVDAFSFVATAGGAVISAVPTKPSGVDVKLEVYDGSGVLVAARDGAANDQQIVLPVGTGTWYVMVSSHGDYGDVGMYDLTVNDLPAGWGSADVGSVGSPGTAGYDATTGTFTVAGSGGDVYGTADGFRFAYQTLTGDGSIVARVVQNQNTNAWSKVGVEIRESLAAGSKHVAMVTTATNGPQLVYRTATGGSSTSVNGTAAKFTPTWVRLVRSGNVITASRSADGVSWTTVRYGRRVDGIDGLHWPALVCSRLREGQRRHVHRRDPHRHDQRAGRNQCARGTFRRGCCAGHRHGPCRVVAGGRGCVRLRGRAVGRRSRIRRCRHRRLIGDQLDRCEPSGLDALFLQGAGDRRVGPVGGLRNRQRHQPTERGDECRRHVAEYIAARAQLARHQRRQWLPHRTVDRRPHFHSARHGGHQRTELCGQWARRRRELLVSDHADERVWRLGIHRDLRQHAAPGGGWAGVRLKDLVGSHDSVDGIE